MDYKLPAVFAITFIAAGLQSISGFGYGIVAVPLLSIFLSPASASILLVVSSVSLNLFLVVRLRAHIKFRPIAPVMISVATGVFVGLFFLSAANPGIFARSLGVYLAVYVLWSVAKKENPVSPLHRYRWGLPLGFVSGILSGAFATGGPPLVVYVSSLSLRHLEHIAALQLLLAVSGSVRLGVAVAGGLLNAGNALLAVTGLAGALAGSVVVLAINPSVSKQKLRVIVLVLVSVLAVKYIVIGA
jgi:uncharacterized protein